MSYAIVLKTHVWNSDIEEFCLKLRNQNGDSFHILVHGTLDIPNVFQSHSYENEQLMNVYPNGYIDEYYSNHWLNMAFYHDNPNYDYYWFLEYDVRISGDSNKLFTMRSDADFLFTKGMYHYPTGEHFTKAFGIEEKDRYQGFLQMARYSNKALSYLDSKFNEGINGQDELAIYSLIRLSNLTYRADLAQLVQGAWTWDKHFSAYNKASFVRNEELNVLAIYHPIK